MAHTLLWRVRTLAVLDFVALCNLLYISVLLTALQKAVFWLAKGGKREAKRPPFTLRKVAFCKSRVKIVGN